MTMTGRPTTTKVRVNTNKICSLLAFATCLLGYHTAEAQVPTSPRIGVILPLSGDHAHIGEQLLDAITLALEDAPGVVWTVVDSGGTEEGARERVRELTGFPDLLAIVGPVGANESRAAAQEAEVIGVPILTLTSQDGIEDLGPMTFRLRVSPEEQSRWMARFAANDLGVERVAILYPEDEFGRSCMRAFLEALEGSSVRVVGVESYELDETDFGDPVELLVNRRYRQIRIEPFRHEPRTRVRRLSHTSDVDFDAIFIPEFDRQVGLIVPFLAFWDVPMDRITRLLGLSSWGGAGLAKSEDLIEGATFTMVYHESLYNSDAERFARAFREAYERDPSEAEAQAFDAVGILLEGVRPSSATPATRLSLAAWLRGGPRHRGATGDLSISTDGAVVHDLSLFATDSAGYISPWIHLR